MPCSQVTLWSREEHGSNNTPASEQAANHRHGPQGKGVVEQRGALQLHVQTRKVLQMFQLPSNTHITLQLAPWNIFVSLGWLYKLRWLHTSKTAGVANVCPGPQCNSE